MTYIEIEKQHATEYAYVLYVFSSLSYLVDGHQRFLKLLYTARSLLNIMPPKRALVTYAVDVDACANWYAFCNFRDHSIRLTGDDFIGSIPGTELKSAQPMYPGVFMGQMSVPTACSSCLPTITSMLPGTCPVTPSCHSLTRWRKSEMQDMKCMAFFASSLFESQQ